MGHLPPAGQHAAIIPLEHAGCTTKCKRKIDPDDDDTYPAFANDADPWKAHFAEIDALLDRTDKVLAGDTPLPKSRSHLVYDPDVDEAENDDAWLDVVKRVSHWGDVTLTRG